MPTSPQVESTAQGRPGAKVDRVLHDRDTVELGGAYAHGASHAGHTPGCTTWTMQVAEGGRMLNAVIIGSPNVNAGYVLVDNKNYPQIAGDYVKTFTLLKSLPVDLFLGAHGAYFNLKDKLPKMGGSHQPVHRSRGIQGVCRGAGTGVREGTDETDGRRAHRRCRRLRHRVGSRRAERAEYRRNDRLVREDARLQGNRA